jgi:hypothetical protein
MLKPNAPIRRFDVFAEFNRQKAMKEGMKASQAKGYGLWLAKVVAARRFGKPKTESPSSKHEAETTRRTKWRELSGEPQTDKLFDKQIIERMGANFYRRVFAPSIRKAIEERQGYEDIRDDIRKDWVP